jgi:type I restriction enzyme, S subunit
MTNNNKEMPFGYKDSPLGLIPQEWEVKRLGEVCSIDSKSLTSKTPPDYTFEYISLSDVDSEYFEIKTSKQIFASAPSRARRIVSGGDILMSTVRPNLQGFSKMPYGINNIVASTGFAVLTPKECYGDYIFTFLFSDKISKQFYELVVGSNYPAVNSSDVANLKIAVPPLEEQRRIAEVLGEWDKAIELQAKLVERLQTRKHALMQQLLTPLRRLPDFTQPWQKVKLGEIATIKKGVQVNKIELGLEGKYPTINGGIEPSGYSDDYNTAANTITISEGGNSCGYVSYITTNFWRGGHCYAAFEKSRIYKVFLFQILKYKESEIMTLRVGSGLPNIQIKPLEKFKLTIPSLDEQKAIAEVLSKSDKEIAIAERKLTALRTQKRALMQQLLTGKKRLKI